MTLLFSVDEMVNIIEIHNYYTENYQVLSSNSCKDVYNLSIWTLQVELCFMEYNFFVK